tara:strand:- start:10 stop:390 length:381 start_codon:yes stop_codon:yes gene_type:complete
MRKLVSISELCEILDLIDPATNKPLNHVLRYWEKEFSQIKPKKINNRRYYSSKDIEIIKMIKFYLKEQKMTVKGVKNILQKNIKNLDDLNRLVYRNDYYKNLLKSKSNSLLSKVKKLKKYGKKNSS